MSGAPSAAHPPTRDTFRQNIVSHTRIWRRLFEVVQPMEFIVHSLPRPRSGGALLQCFHYAPECQSDYLNLLGHKGAQVHDETIGFDSPYYGRIVSAKEFLDLIRAEIA